MAVKLSISGINAVLSGLDDFGEDVHKLVMSEVRDWAENTEAAAKRDVPVDTSALKNSIRSVLGANGLHGLLRLETILLTTLHLLSSEQDLSLTNHFYSNTG